jgi:hypothetical protein
MASDRHGIDRGDGQQQRSANGCERMASRARSKSVPTPVWSIAPDAVVVSPAPQDSIELSRETEIWGWAWADQGIGRVEVRISDSPKWRRAELEPPRGREWQRFSLAWTPEHRGPTLIASRAQAITGERQPIAGRRNAIHGVAVSVV